MIDTKTKTLLAIAHAEKAHRNVLVAFDLLEDACTALAKLPDSIYLSREPDGLPDSLIAGWIDEKQFEIRAMLDEVLALARAGGAG